MGLKSILHDLAETVGRTGLHDAIDALETENPGTPSSPGTPDPDSKPGVGNETLTEGS